MGRPISRTASANCWCSHRTVTCSHSVKLSAKILRKRMLMTEAISLPFDHVKAHEHITRTDKRMARIIAKTGAFRFQLDQCDSVYESLLEAIVYQSISGKAAVTIYARVEALGSNGPWPTPAEILGVSHPRLPREGLSGPKAAPMKALAQKTIDGIVPTLEAAGLLSDEELVE